MSPRRTAVGVISKLPRLGRSKTRLARTVGVDAALTLHRAFVLDELDQLHAPERWSLHLVHDPALSPDDHAELAGLIRGRATSVVPAREGLPAELLGAFELLLRDHDRAVVVSADVPQVDAGRVADALAALDDADLVLGPGPDGGYWLVGLKAPNDVFTPIRMGQGPVTAATIALAERLGLRVATMPPLTDVDEAQDLIALDGLPERLARRSRSAAADLERSEVALRLPTELQLEVTSRCNLRCAACLRTHEQLDPDADLTLADFHRIVEPLPDLQRVGFMLNGESMLAADLPAMIAAAVDRGAWTVLNTNGTLLDSHRRAALLESGLHELRISLDGARPETVLRMAGLDVLDRVLDGVSALVRERGAAPRPAVSLWMVATRSTIGELPGLVRAAVATGVDEVYLQRLVLTGHGAAVDDESLFGRIDDAVEAALVEAEAEAARSGVTLRASGRRPLRESMTPSGEPNPQAACWRPWRSAVVTASMRVLPCCISSFVEPYGTLSRGDLRKQSWPEVWNGPGYRALRRGILAGEPLSCCADCGVRWSL
jgi:MoaA/NifB/PqqE/SkfB family radical SAM enzyme/glycosyltransferase A (GT-A) superfamily protein (DUF2064 family)